MEWKTVSRLLTPIARMDNSLYMSPQRLFTAGGICGLHSARPYLAKGRGATLCGFGFSIGKSCILRLPLLDTSKKDGMQYRHIFFVHYPQSVLSMIRCFTANQMGRA